MRSFLVGAGRTERKENDQWSFLANGPDGARIARHQSTFVQYNIYFQNIKKALRCEELLCAGERTRTFTP